MPTKPQLEIRELHHANVVESDYIIHFGGFH